MSETAIGTDAAGYELITEAMKDLLNQFPGLLDGETIKYEQLGETDGIAFYNNSGALVYTETEDVTGMYHQTCQYPFYVVYRASSAYREEQKISIQEFLDALGKWLCGEDAVVDGEIVEAAEMPSLAAGREIKRITRDNSYGLEPGDNGVQDWILPVTVKYKNEF